MDKQKYSSAETSINKNKVPALYKIVEKYISKNSTILDYGAGKYNTGIEYYKEKNITVLPYDKYNRSKESNLKTFEGDRSGKGKPTCKGYQRNAKTNEYIPFLKMVFPLVERKGKLLIARKTKLGWSESLNF